MSDVWSFRAMGCAVVVAGATADERHAIEELFDLRERTFSRFRADSELMQVNASTACAVAVSADFARVVEASLAAAEQTDGLVDPTLLRALEAAGYDVDFPSLSGCERPLGRAVPGARRSVRLLGRVLLRPPGVGLDLNGVVKALTVDDAAELLSGPGFVSAGGDLVTRGGVDVALPGGGEVRLQRGALATSGSATRRWLRGGAIRHHLIDPVTGRPAASPWEQVTACGATCLGADVAAKAAFLLGDDGPAWLDERGIPGRFLRADGAIVANRAWATSTVPACT